jgi:hypothetical protein
MKKFACLLAAGSLALTLAACGGPPEANETVVETNLSDVPEPDNAMGNMVMPEPSPSPSVTPAPAGTGKEFDETVTQDDADATGMTSRVSRDGDNSSQPAQ